MPQTEEDGGDGEELAIEALEIVFKFQAKLLDNANYIDGTELDYSDVYVSYGPSGKVICAGPTIAFVMPAEDVAEMTFSPIALTTPTSQT